VEEFFGDATQSISVDGDVIYNLTVVAGKH
jgi:hypothetical protein